MRELDFGAVFVAVLQLHPNLGHVSIDEDNAYFHGIRKRWGEALREAFAELPDPDWLIDRTI